MDSFKVFISSVVSGFEKMREAAREAIESYVRSNPHLNIRPVMVERDLPALNLEGQQAYRDAVQDCNLMISILGPRYGWPNEQTGISASEEEWDLAVEIGKDRLAFIQRPPADGKDAEFFEPEQLEFKQKVSYALDSRFWRRFETAGDLKFEIYQALDRYFKEEVAPVSFMSIEDYLRKPQNQNLLYSDSLVGASWRDFEDDLVARRHEVDRILDKLSDSETYILLIGRSGYGKSAIARHVGYILTSDRLADDEWKVWISSGIQEHDVDTLAAELKLRDQPRTLFIIEDAQNSPEHCCKLIHRLRSKPPLSNASVLVVSRHYDPNTLLPGEEHLAHQVIQDPIWVSNPSGYIETIVEQWAAGFDYEVTPEDLRTARDLFGRHLWILNRALVLWDPGRGSLADWVGAHFYADAYNRFIQSPIDAQARRLALDSSHMRDILWFLSALSLYEISGPRQWFERHKGRYRTDTVELDALVEAGLLKKWYFRSAAFYGVLHPSLGLLFLNCAQAQGELDGLGISLFVLFRLRDFLFGPFNPGFTIVFRRLVTGRRRDRERALTLLDVEGVPDRIAGLLKNRGMRGSRICETVYYISQVSHNHAKRILLDSIKARALAERLDRERWQTLEKLAYSLRTLARVDPMFGQEVLDTLIEHGTFDRLLGEQFNLVGSGLLLQAVNEISYEVAKSLATKVLRMLCEEHSELHEQIVLAEQPIWEIAAFLHGLYWADPSSAAALFDEISEDGLTAQIEAGLSPGSVAEIVEILSYINSSKTFDIIQRLDLKVFAGTALNRLALDELASTLWGIRRINPYIAAAVARRLDIDILHEKWINLDQHSRASRSLHHLCLVNRQKAIELVIDIGIPDFVRRIHQTWSPTVAGFMLENLTLIDPPTARFVASELDLSNLFKKASREPLRVKGVTRLLYGLTTAMPQKGEKFFEELQKGRILQSAFRDEQDLFNFGVACRLIADSLPGEAQRIVENVYTAILDRCQGKRNLQDVVQFMSGLSALGVGEKSVANRLVADRFLWLCEQVKDISDPYWIGAYFQAVCQIEPELGGLLAEVIDWQEVESVALTGTPIGKLSRFFLGLHEAGVFAGEPSKELPAFPINVKGLLTATGNKIMEEPRLTVIADFLRGAKDLGPLLRDHILVDPDAAVILAGKINREARLGPIASLLGGLYEVSPELAQETALHARTDLLVKLVNREYHVWRLAWFFRSIRSVSETKAAEVITHKELDRDHFLQRALWKRDPALTADLLYEIHLSDPSNWTISMWLLEELCSLPEYKSREWLQKLKEADILEVCAFLGVAKEIHGPSCRRIYNRLDLGRLVSSINSAYSFIDLAYVAMTLGYFNAFIAEDVYRRIDWKRAANSTVSDTVWLLGWSIWMIEQSLVASAELARFTCLHTIGADMLETAICQEDSPFRLSGLIGGFWKALGNGLRKVALERLHETMLIASETDQFWLRETMRSVRAMDDPALESHWSLEFSWRMYRTLWGVEAEWAKGGPERLAREEKDEIELGGDKEDDEDDAGTE